MDKYLILYVLFPFLYTMPTLYMMDYFRDKVQGNKYLNELIIMTLATIISAIFVLFLLLIVVKDFEDYIYQSKGWGFIPMSVFTGVIYKIVNRLLSK